MVMLLCVTLSGCGSDNSTQKTDAGDAENKNEEFKKYADLTKPRRIGSFDDAWIDFPAWREDGSETCRVGEFYNYYILAVISDEDYDFDELFNNETKSDLRFFVDRGVYEDFVPDTKEEVTLENGLNASVFEGTLTMEDYGDIYNFPTYGYFLKFNNYKLMVMAVETNTGSANNSEERWNDAKRYVSQMVETIRDHEQEEIVIKIILGFDHQGLKCKDLIINYLSNNGYEVIVPSIANTDTDDYPDYAKWVAEKVIADKALGILVCGSGIGMSIAANKINGIRCARVVSENDAFTAKNHNGANVIAFSSSLSFEEICKIIDTFVMTKSPSEERHLRRINKIIALESDNNAS